MTSLNMKSSEINLSNDDDHQEETDDTEQQQVLAPSQSSQVGQTSPQRTDPTNSPAVLHPSITTTSHTNNNQRWDDMIVCEIKEKKACGRLILGDCGQSSLVEPEWLDKEKWNRAKVIAHKYFFSLMFIHMAGLVLLVHVKSILVPLLWTGKSKTVSELFLRYLSTLLHVKAWYEGDVWNPEDPAHRSLMQVRGMHKRVATPMNANKVKGKDEMNISQYDMLVTQVAFVGLAVLHPDKVAIKLSDEDLEALLHFWRGIGYLLGVEDRFNLCSGDLERVRAYCREIMYKEMVVAAADTPIHEAKQMSHGIVQAVKAFVPLLTYHALIKYLYEIFQIERPIRISFYAKIGYHAMKFTYSRAAHYGLIMSMLSSLLRLSLWVTNVQKERIARGLERRHKMTLGRHIGDVTIPSACPMSVSVESEPLDNNNITEVVA